jgi:hypothetical protein
VLNKTGLAGATPEPIRTYGLVDTHPSAGTSRGVAEEAKGLQAGGRRFDPGWLHIEKACR